MDLRQQLSVTEDRHGRRTIAIILVDDSTVTSGVEEHVGDLDAVVR